MCKPGTWCDAVVIQGVANAYSLIIYIFGCSHNCCRQTVLEGLNLSQSSRSIIIGYDDQRHYVSTISIACNAISDH